MPVDLERARALFGDDDLGWIVERLVARLERGHSLDGRLRLDRPTESQREALARLLGRRPSPSGPASTVRSISVGLEELARVLERAGIAPDLRGLVEALRGRVIDRTEAAAAERAGWEAAHRRLRSVATALDPRLGLWVDDLEAGGMLRRLAKGIDDAERLGREAVAVLEQLPAAGMPLAQLAASTLGDSHALDAGAPPTTLVLRALEVLTGLPRRDRSAEERRTLWARAGVLLDELAASALVLGLAPDGDGLLARTLRAHTEAGEPCRLTLRQLVRHPPDWAPLSGTCIAVCENPTVVAAAADRLGTASPPLVCTEGHPSGAVQTLLGRLVDAGAFLRFHTDFDRGGLRIGNLLADRFGARPWRMGRADYEAAAGARGVPLTSPPEKAMWDAELATCLSARGVAVHEEQLLEGLLADLATWPPSR